MSPTSFTSLSLIALILAAIPCVLFLSNLTVYRPPRRRRVELQERSTGAEQHRAISVLIPARNEAHNIRATLEAVLASQEVEFEVLVLDDHSTDGTAEIVRPMAARDSRLRLESAPSLPEGWCGKQHACHVLGGRARHPLLVFIDADVRLASDALAQMSDFMAVSPAALASGVPRQEVGTFAEKLLLPLIHFILLGFLPMRLMRLTRFPSLSAGCGQLFVARREAYHATGGHAMIRTSLHDGLMLPRLFRRFGYATDLFDATLLATCRMYHTNGEVIRGLGKNATEGLAAPRTIGPMTVLLLGGQVLPFLLLLLSPWPPASMLVVGMAVGLSYLPRLLAAHRFRQPWLSIALHPLSVLALLAIQWLALARHGLGKPSMWKGRSYPQSAAVHLPHPPAHSV